MKSITTNRPAISSRIKRKVRQRCGFGCVICGLPIYDYDHILGYANVKRHKANELTLLCPDHHRMKTNGLLTNNDVIKANKKPYNLSNGTTSPFELSFSGQSPEIVVGTQTFRCSDKRRPTLLVPIMMDKHILFGFTIDTKGIMLNGEARDSNDNIVLLIIDSEIIISSGIWDFTLVGRTLKIQEDLRKYIIEVEFDPPERIIVKRYKIAFGKTTVEVFPDKIKFTGGFVSFFSITGEGGFDANIGILVGDKPKNLSVGLKIGE